MGLRAGANPWRLPRRSASAQTSTGPGSPFVVTAGVLFIGTSIGSFLIDAEKPLIQE
jgi:hypothetical protein